MQELITRLLDEGYEVSFTSEPSGYVASVSRAGVCECGHAEERHTLHVDDESVPVGRGLCATGCGCGDYAVLSEGYSHDCIAATPLGALGGALPPGIEAPEGEPGDGARIEARIASLEEIVAELEERTCSEVPLLVRVIGNLVEAQVAGGGA